MDICHCRAVARHRWPSAPSFTLSHRDIIVSQHISPPTAPSYASLLDFHYALTPRPTPLLPAARTSPAARARQRRLHTGIFRPAPQRLTRVMISSPHAAHAWPRCPDDMLLSRSLSCHRPCLGDACPGYIDAFKRDGRLRLHTTRRL